MNTALQDLKPQLPSVTEVKPQTITKDLCDCEKKNTKAKPTISGDDVESINYFEDQLHNHIYIK